MRDAKQLLGPGIRTLGEIVSREKYLCLLRKMYTVLLQPGISEKLAVELLCIGRTAIYLEDEEDDSEETRVSCTEWSTFVSLL